MVKQKVSPSKTWDGFDWKIFAMGFKKPAIVLITFGISTLAANPELMPIIAGLGGVSILAERAWAVTEFFIKEIKL